MKEKTLLRIALITALLCLPVLFFLSSTETITPSSLDDPDFKQDMMVRIEGIIDAVKTGESVTSFRLLHPTTTEVVIFGNASLQKGNRVAVVGKLDSTGKQIIAEEVEVEP